MNLFPVGDDDCHRCAEQLPIPLIGCVGDVEPVVCSECATELAAQPYTITGSAVVIDAAGLPDLNTARIVIEWLDVDALVEPRMAVWLGGDRAAEHYALALGSHAMQQPLHMTVRIRPGTGTADLDALAV